MELTLTIPETANLSKTDAQILFAIKLYETEKLSLGKAAEVAGLPYRTFYDLLIRYGIPVINIIEEEIEQEISNAERLL